MKLPHKLVIWILGCLFAICIIIGCSMACKTLQGLMVAHMKPLKQDVGLGYSPPPKPKEVKDAK